MTPDTVENGGREVVGKVREWGRKILRQRGGLRKGHFGARVEESFWARRGWWGEGVRLEKGGARRRDGRGRGRDNSRSSTITAPTTPLMLQRIPSGKKTRSLSRAATRLVRLFFGFSHLIFLPSPPARGGYATWKLTKLESRTAGKSRETISLGVLPIDDESELTFN